METGKYQPIPVRDSFEQASENLRHYSTLIWKSRVVTIAQGLAILASVSFVLKEGNYIFASLLSCFGIAFALVLRGLMWNYLQYFEDIRDYLKNFEHEGGFPSYQDNVEAPRDSRLYKRLGGFRIIYGPITLFLATYFLVFLYSGYMIARSLYLDSLS